MQHTMNTSLIQLLTPVLQISSFLLLLVSLLSNDAHTHTHTSPCTTDIRVNWFLESKKRKRTTIEIFGASFVDARLEDVEGIK